MKHIFTILLIISLYTVNGWAWSSKGHQAIAYIAKRHLTPTAATHVNTILNGNSMTYVASWLDAAAYDAQYAYTSTWHYINVDEDETYETRYHNPAGDAVSAMIRSIATLDEEESSATEKEFALKVLIHVTGDLHQPLHAGHKTDLGGNSIKVNYMGESTNLHYVWDRSLIESAYPGRNYYDWAINVDNLSDDEAKLVTNGTIDDWARDCVNEATAVYHYLGARTTITADDVTYWTPVIEKQFVKAGLRLAHLLNTLLDPDSNASVNDITTTPAMPSGNFYHIDGRMAIDEGSVKAGKMPSPGIYVRANQKLIIR